jgi:ribonuclease D
VLQELAAWREGRAERADRPRRWLIEDKALVDLARTDPRPGADQIAEIAELTRRQERQWASEIAQAIVTGAKRQPPPAVAPSRLAKQDEAEIRRLVALVKSRADELGVSPPALATSGDVRKIFARGLDADVRTLTGWRRHQIGDALLEAVAMTIR